MRLRNTKQSQAQPKLKFEILPERKHSGLDLKMQQKYICFFLLLRLILEVTRYFI